MKAHEKKRKRNEKPAKVGKMKKIKQSVGVGNVVEKAIQMNQPEPEPLHVREVCVDDVGSVVSLLSEDEPVVEMATREATGSEKEGELGDAGPARAGEIDGVQDTSLHEPAPSCTSYDQEVTKNPVSNQVKDGSGKFTGNFDHAASVKFLEYWIDPIFMSDRRAWEKRKHLKSELQKKHVGYISEFAGFDITWKQVSQKKSDLKKRVIKLKALQAASGGKPLDQEDQELLTAGLSAFGSEIDTSQNKMRKGSVPRGYTLQAGSTSSKSTRDRSNSLSKGSTRHERSGSVPIELADESEYGEGNADAPLDNTFDDTPVKTYQGSRPLRADTPGIESLADSTPRKSQLFGLSKSKGITMKNVIDKRWESHTNVIGDLGRGITSSIDKLVDSLKVSNTDGDLHEKIASLENKMTEINDKFDARFDELLSVLASQSKKKGK